MKTLQLSIIAVLLVILGTSTSYGQYSTTGPFLGFITIKTNKPAYDYGNTITVEGNTTKYGTVTIQIFDPFNQPVIHDKIISQSYGHFSKSYLMLGPLWKSKGIYTLTSQQGSFSYDKTTFYFTGRTNPGGITEKTQFPLKQFKSGIAAKDVHCKEGLQLVIKSEDGSPACVIQKTAQKLVERGWTKEISYATPTNSTSNMQQDQVTNLPSGLQLSLYVGPSTIHAGQPIVIDMFLRNTLSKPVVVPVENHWAIKAAGLEYCIPNPAGLAILKGYYTKDNMTQGKLLWFYDPYVTCPAVSYNIENYQFDPLSSHAKSANCVTPSYEAMCNINTSKYIATKGYWTIENGFHTFDLGNYTVVGAEQSGYTVIQHFTVVNSTETYTTNNQPITVQTNDVRGTIKDIMTGTTFTELASSSTGIQISRGGGFDSYDNDSIKLELYHGKTSDSHVIAVTVKNTGKRTVHIYAIDISGFIPITNDSSQNIIVVKDDPSIVPKEDAILEPGESQTKYIVGNWTVGGKPVNGFSAGMSYSYDDLQNYDGITNGYAMSVPVQWIQK